MSDNWLAVEGVVLRGHKVASRKSEHYPRGTIEMQLPFFKALGLDLTPFFRGTLNISISPHTFTIKDPQYTFRKVNWTSRHPPEDFSFSRCRVVYAGVKYEGWIYYPHPETKKRHFQDPSIVEVIAPLIPDLGYGDRVQIDVNSVEVSLNKRGL